MFSAPTQNGSKAYLASYMMGTGLFPAGKAFGALCRPPLHVVPRSEKECSYPPPPFISHYAVNFTFTIVLICVNDILSHFWGKCG